MTIGSISASAGAHFPGRRQKEPHDRSHREGAKRVWEGIGAPGRSVLPRAHPKPPELGCADSHQTVRRWLPLIRTGPCPDMTKGTRQPYNCQSPPFEVSVSMSVATDPQ
jgi:hypothetical protein